MKKNFLSDCIKDFTGLIYPELCVGCGQHLNRQEEVVCRSCEYHLPITKFHLMRDNPVEEAFWGRVEIDAATAYCYFVKGGKLQKMLHALKYHNRQDVGFYLGKRLGSSLQWSSRFKQIDFVVPVPLHPKKERLRGYNQSKSIAQGIAESIESLVVEPLKRVVYNPTQTKKGRYERWENVDGIFQLENNQDWSGKHFLLVDDVMTTGSTLEAAAIALRQASNAKVSITVIGLA